MECQNTNSRPNILIVDDQPENIKVVAGLLKEKYTTKAATSGSRAIELALSKDHPDLILLDIAMPGMSGYDVCNRLKSEKETRNIPVIFITALNETENEMKGLEIGAVDYIRKPVNPDILEARVQTHLELKRHRDCLAQLAEERALQLMHAERLATIGSLTAGIFHEIRNPLTHILGNVQLMQLIFKDINEDLNSYLKGANGKEIKWLNFNQKSERFLNTIFNSGTRIQSIIDSMQMFSRRDIMEKAPLNVETCIDEALQISRFVKFTKLSGSKMAIRKKIDQPLPAVSGDHRRLCQVFTNLFNNAADAMIDSDKPVLKISAVSGKSHVRITIQDNGRGIPENSIHSIWEPFFTTKPDSMGTGLGLSITREIIEDHNGTISAENCSNGGARFIIDLPSWKQDHHRERKN